jgi:cysteine sulfinate desulfinase/cysteine desulfurase-like protein
VIAALGLPERWMRGVIRFSLGRTTTEAHIARVVEVLEQAVADLRTFAQA